ncbi:MAG: PQQ-dependent sugar dehydrogenase [Flammeovirgaceae bacterium]|nr:PQQ-dependent sugar dehydrogenase [Flammeovirgaceae bacterium]
MLDIRNYIYSLVLILSIISCDKEEIIEGNDAYEVVDIKTPEGLRAENGGIAFLPDGRMVACFHLGEVLIYDPKTEEWSVFAKGLHDPLGVYPINEYEMLVMHRPELTRLVDTDKDGKADLYQTVTDQFGISGNYHEYNYGPEPDGNGAFFISLNDASNGAGIWKEVRGEFRPEGRPGRMYSCVPYRGWVMKVNAENGELIPWASGFRSPNGIAVDKKGGLFITDNQGDWLGTSKLYHVEKGKFYGHPSSLVWEKGFEGIDPLTIPVPILDKMRQKGSILFPHSILANSPTQPVFDYTGGKFGPFEDQMIIGEMDHDFLLRVMLDEVDGETQGACVPFVSNQGLTKGNNRIAWSPDGNLYAGKSDRGWVGGKGLQKISWNGKTPMDVYEMKLTKSGFELTFTLPLASETALDPLNYSFKRYYYEYHRKYGSKQFDVTEVEVKEVSLTKDGMGINIDLENLISGYVYELTLNESITSQKSTPINNKIIYYTLNNLRVQ